MTSIDVARPDGQAHQSTKSKHPAVTGGQGSRVVVDRGRTPSAPESDKRAEKKGVSSLEPSFQRALFKGQLSGPLEDSDRSAGGEPIVVASPSRKPDNPPEPRPFNTIQHPAPHAYQRQREPMSDTTPLPVDEVNQALQAGSGITSRQLSAARHEPMPTDARSAEPIVHVDGVQLEAGSTREHFRQPETSPPHPVSPLDDVPWVAAIPRCCDTCREFQRDPGGKTGHCGSPYALGKRAMVKSDELACRSSVGVWWLPSDDLWLDRADISHHTRPTPYLDAILDDLRPESR